MFVDFEYPELRNNNSYYFITMTYRSTYKMISDKATGAKKKFNFLGRLSIC